MAYINIKTKGVSEMTLTRNYNSLSVWSQNKDDVGFNEAGTAFNDYCMNSTCGNWANDKIIIRTLPDKGYLFYNTNPTGVSSYAPVTVGQEFLTKDLIDYKILKFSAEGNSDNQYSENYLTTFSFERFCGTVSSNEITTIKLNMLDLKENDVIINNGEIFIFHIYGAQEPPTSYAVSIPISSQISFSISDGQELWRDTQYVIIANGSQNINTETTNISVIANAPNMPNGTQITFLEQNVLNSIFSFQYWFDQD